MYFKSHETEQCYTSSIIWVKCSNRPCYWLKKKLLTEISKLGYAIAYDNVDHNTDTLDGKGTFNGMGIIAFSILNKDLPDKRVKRIQTVFKRETIERKDSIKFH